MECTHQEGTLIQTEDFRDWHVTGDSSVITGAPAHMRDADNGRGTMCV